MASSAEDAAAQRMRAMMLADLGNDRKDALAYVDADHKGQLLGAAERRAKDNLIEQISRDRQRKLNNEADPVIKAWNSVELVDADDPVSKLKDYWGGQAHRAKTNSDGGDHDFHRYVDKVGEERAIYMMEQKRQRGREHGAGSIRTSNGHLRASSPRAQGSVRYVKGEMVSKNKTPLPAPKARQANGANNTAPKAGPSKQAGRTPMPASPSKYMTPRQKKALASNNAVKSGPPPSQMVEKLRSHTKAHKLENNAPRDRVASPKRFVQPEDRAIINDWSTFAKKESTISFQRSTVGNTSTSRPALVPTLHKPILQTATSENVVIVEEEQDWLTLKQLVKESPGISRLALTNCLRFLFDVNRQLWFEDNFDLLEHYKHTGALVRQEMMILAQLPETSARMQHFYKNFSFIPQIKEHMAAARLAVDVALTKDADAKKFFEENDQYLPFYKMALWICEHKPLQQYESEDVPAVSALQTTAKVTEKIPRHAAPAVQTVAEPAMSVSVARALSTSEQTASTVSKTTIDTSNKIDKPKPSDTPAPQKVNPLMRSKWATPSLPGSFPTASAASYKSSATSSQSGDHNYKLISGPAVELQSANNKHSEAVEQALAKYEMQPTKQSPEETMRVMESNVKKMRERMGYKKNGIWYST